MRFAPLHPTGAEPPRGLPSTDGIRSIAKPTIAILVARAVLWMLFYALSIVNVSLGPAVVYDGIQGLLGLAGLIFYFVWFARFYGWVRAARGGTKYSTGLAIGGWFIPLANLVFPFLGLNDAWRRANEGKGTPLVILWWLSYLAVTVLSVFFAATNGMEIDNLPISVKAVETVFTSLDWLDRLVQMTAFGLWAFIVKELTAKAQ